jgi:hypothetical protein
MLRTAWALVSWPTLAMIAVACALMALIPTGEKIFEALIPLPLLVGIGLLSSRISRVLEVGVWRMLPDGQRTVIRAVGFLVVAMSLLFGALYAWAAPKVLEEVPLGTVLALFIHFSLLALLLLLGIGRQLPRGFTVIYLGVCIISLGNSLQYFQHQPALWIGGAIVCAAAWVFVSVVRLPTPHSSRRLFAFDHAALEFFARARRDIPSGPSPAAAALRAGTGGAATLLIASLIITIWAVMQHTTFGRIPALPFRLMIAMPLSGAALAGILLSARYARAMRAVWMRWGNSRAEAFGLCERMARVESATVAFIACAVVIGLVAARGAPLPLLDSLKMFAASLGVAMLATYVGLAFSTLHVRWHIAAGMVFCAAVAFIGTGWWLRALGARGPEIGPVNLSWTTFLLLAIVVMRYVALFRWKRIDWSHFRPLKRGRIQ